MGAIRKGVVKQRRDDTSFTEYAEGGKVDPEDAKRQEAIKRANIKSKAARDEAAMKGLRGTGPSSSKAYTGTPPSKPEVIERPNFVNPKDVQRYREEMQDMPELAKGGKVGLYDNIHAKRKRIAAGSDEAMRKPGSRGAPTAKAFKRSALTAKG
jgi:hypothetical protein